MRRVSAEFGVPYSTLRNRLYGTQNRRDAAQSQQLLSRDAEKRLTDWIQVTHQTTLGRAPTHDQIGEFVSRMLAAQGNPQRVGKTWIRRFVARNPVLKAVKSKKKVTARIDSPEDEAANVVTTSPRPRTAVREPASQALCDTWDVGFSTPRNRSEFLHCLRALASDSHPSLVRSPEDEGTDIVNRPPRPHTPLREPASQALCDASEVGFSTPRTRSELQRCLEGLASGPHRSLVRKRLIGYIMKALDEQDFQRARLQQEQKDLLAELEALDFPKRKTSHRDLDEEFANIEQIHRARMEAERVEEEVLIEESDSRSESGDSVALWPRPTGCDNFGRGGVDNRCQA